MQVQLSFHDAMDAIIGLAAPFFVITLLRLKCACGEQELVLIQGMVPY